MASSSKVVVVEVISKETIKPSSPTPHHLRNFKLSLMDQFSPLIYVQTILFYTAADGMDHDDQVHNNVHHIHRSNLLKKSLSETITRFYPVAGRLKDNIWVDCNDEGVDYFEARVKGNMSDFMSRLEDESVLHHQLVPVPFHNEPPNYNLAYKEALLVVQVSMFDCSGMAIAVCISHKIADATTMTTFVNAWAANNSRCGSLEIVCPTFDSASLFPPNDLLSSIAPDTGRAVGGISFGEKVITKRFVFDAFKIAELRAKIAAASSTTMKNYPTRVEVVSALIWKSSMEASRVKLASSSSKPISSVVKHVVNLRPKMDTPLPKVSFGNIVTVATAEWKTTPGVVVELDELVGQLRRAINKINGDYIKKLQGYDVFLSSVEESCRLEEEEEEVVEVYWMSSWCRFPLYETDFGWGKPIWISSGTSKQYKNGVLLMDTRCGEGIEALVCLEEENMAIFQHDPELLQFLSNH
ncbi:Transferase [Macleaya cordata]|uniref:Transferase n=1 Tax=Macleaya cordata TaxID=56857 RepID=A0A200RAZ1_MACCD|nr:Transferase [Macleaya cordata]